MPVKWTQIEKLKNFRELNRLYVLENRTIGEISTILGVGQSTVYDRLLRLGITPTPNKKDKFLNIKKLSIPNFSDDLAEVIGILLGDGNVSESQVRITFGATEIKYLKYVQKLFKEVFGIKPKMFRRKSNHLDLYAGSVVLIRFLMDMGFVRNKKLGQVGVPSWILKGSSSGYKERFIRGFFDTDGSIYQLQHGGWQISFCNSSTNLLKDTRNMLIELGYSPSKISGMNLYLTRKNDLIKFECKVGPRQDHKAGRLRGCCGAVKRSRL
ncbi:MAG: LAGLIDADG family homing endonuclease [Patescibacteria group bacterium]